MNRAKSVTSRFRPAAIPIFKAGTKAGNILTDKPPLVRNQHKSKQPIKSPKDLDKLACHLVWFPPMEGPNKASKREKKKGASKRGPELEKLQDLSVIHIIGEKRFNDQSRQYAQATINGLPKHPLLSALDDAAKVTACTYLFEAHMAYKLRESGSYWVLDRIDSVYPFPLGVCRDYIPRWQRSARKLERILRELEELIGQVDAKESGLLPSRIDEMPCSLIADAASKLYKAVEWMRAFPSPVELRSKQRNVLRIDPESESTEVLAYALDWIFRKRSTDNPKIKDIECRIAQLEYEFLGVSVTFDDKFGCPAVRGQIRRIKSKKTRKAIESKLQSAMDSADLWYLSAKLGAGELENRLNLQAELWDQFSQHTEAFQTWTEKAQADLKGKLGCQLKGPMTPEELLKVTGNYDAEIRKHLSACTLWLQELTRHEEATKSLEGNLQERVIAAREWMRRCESTWNSATGTAHIPN